MNAGRFYTVAQVAKISDYSEAEILKYINSGMLNASFNQNYMNYLVLHDDLAVFLKGQNLGDRLERVAKHRVMIVDRNQQTTFILKTELERSGKVDTVAATSSRDIDLSLKMNLPDLIVMHLGAFQRTADNLASVLQRWIESRHINVLLFHDRPDAVLRDSADIQKLVADLKLEVINVARGMKPLLQKIHQRLDAAEAGPAAKSSRAAE
ncbi:MAG: hypothetical protein HY716_07315 [Planctomycetes bacterium]|nr:hypothetical protein [Planctomycetota bacterium]